MPPDVTITPRVLWVIKGLGPGGAERLLVAHANALASNRTHVECAYVLAQKDHLADDLERAGVRTHCLSRTERDWRWPARLVSLVRSGRWDVIHVHSPLPGSVARLAVRSMPTFNRPHVITTEHNRWSTHRIPTRLANRLTSRWDDVTFAVTDEVGESMRGPAAERVVTLRHGVDVAAIRARVALRSEVRAELGIGIDDVVVGTVANFRQQKDYPNLLASAKLLGDRGVVVRFVLVGQGPDEAATRQLSEELGLDHMVLFTGFRADATRVMSAFDVFALASRWEGLPVALMEALALGLPIVATDVGGVTEVMTDDVDALLVASEDPAALADALERMVRDDSLRRQFGRRASERADEFDVARAIETLSSAYGFERSPSVRRVTAVAERHERPARRRPIGLDIRAATSDDRPAILELCRASLGWGHDPRFGQLFSWKHDDNPFGPSYMWVAVDGDRVVGLRAFMRWDFSRGSEVLRAVRAVDTATHPDYQGRGLFAAMTMLGVESLEADGVDFIFNTPNAQSRPGYLKMGWEEVGQVPAAIRLVRSTSTPRLLRSRVAASHWPIQSDFGCPVDAVVHEWGAPAAPGSPRLLTTRRDLAFHRWRFGPAFLGYRFVAAEDGWIVARCRRRGQAKELAVLSSSGLSDLERDRVAIDLGRSSGSDYAIRLGGQSLRRGFVSAPFGPRLTFRSVSGRAMPAPSQWALDLADIELF